MKRSLSPSVHLEVKRCRAVISEGVATEQATPDKLGLGRGAGECWLEQGRLPADLALPSLQVLWDLRPEERGRVHLYGREHATPRWFQSYQRAYHFSGLAHPALPLPDLLQSLKTWADGLGFGVFDQVLVNWYANGHDCIHRHADSERQLRPNSPIVSVSLGATRIFRIRRKHGGRGIPAIVKDVQAVDHSYLIMGGAFQSHYTHEVPKIAGRKGESVGRRVNVTFRQFL